MLVPLGHVSSRAEDFDDIRRERDQLMDKCPGGFCERARIVPVQILHPFVWFESCWHGHAGSKDGFLV